MSRHKFDRSREFIPSYKVVGGHWRSVAVQTVSEPEICHGAGFKLRADERVRVQRPLRICLECRSKSKKCDKQLTHIVRVTGSICFILCLTYSKNPSYLCLGGGGVGGADGLGGGTSLIFRGGGGGGGGGVVGFGCVMVFYFKSPIIVIGINKSRSMKRYVLVKK